MKTVILVPYRSDGGGRRDELWRFTRAWLEKHHPGWEIYEGESPDGPFNRGAAINDAARQAGDWDVAVIHDGDNIADPGTLCRAVELARDTDKCVFPFGIYLYLDEYSSQRLMTEDNWFVGPDWVVGWSVIPGHYSGVQALSKAAYEKVGGFIELTGWGHEDWIMSVLFRIFANGTEHLQGGAYHLFHGGRNDPERSAYGDINREVMADVMGLSVMPDQLRDYLRAGGHSIP
jgi:hypothetical protein